MKWLKVRLSKAKEWIVEKWKVALIVVGVVLVPLIVWKVPEWQVRAYHGRLDAGAISKLTPQELIQLQKDLITAENNARATVAQILGGVALLLGLYATFKNVKVAQDNLRVTEEGKLTDRFSKAVELLGSDKLDVRLGGIYALERIARDSLKDHWTVMEVLTAFVREQSRKEQEKPPQWVEDEGYPEPYPVEAYMREVVDVQAALTVICRRKWIEQERPHQRIDLSKSFLKGANLRGAKLHRAHLFDTNLEGADLIDAKLGGAYLCAARLKSASLNKADLSEADLRGSNLDGADLYGADLRGSNLLAATLREVRGLIWEQISEATIDDDYIPAKLPPELEERRKAEQEKKAAAPNQ